MAMPEARPEITLRLSRTFAAPRERVFAAWTDPALIKQWWGPEGCECTEAESDPRPGGVYRFSVRHPDKGEVFTVRGAYREVVPPERLVYTWRWEQWDAEMWETLVTVEFHARGDSTELVLTHERFRDDHMRDEHGSGWNSALDCLAAYLG